MVIVSDDIGLDGIVIMSVRAELNFDIMVQGDSMPLNYLAAARYE